MEKAELNTLKYSEKEMSKKFRKIYKTAISESKSINDGNYIKIGTWDLKRIFQLYDKYFFEHYFVENCRYDFIFQFSRRMTKSSGRTSILKNKPIIKITLSSNLLFQTFRQESREIRIGGRVCKDRLESTMRIFEHELVHVVEFILFGKTNCKKSVFKRIALNIFGHSDVSHGLVNQYENAAMNFGLKVNDQVSYIHKGKKHFGFISRITKRATVMVLNPQGNYVNSEGVRFSKSYVPLARLKKMNE